MDYQRVQRKPTQEPTVSTTVKTVDRHRTRPIIRDDMIVEINQENRHKLDECFNKDDDDETDTEIAEAFRTFDLDSDGFLQPPELRHALENMGISLTDEELAEMVIQGDTDRDGRIGLQDFYIMMTSDSATIKTGNSARKQTNMSDANKP